MRRKPCFLAGCGVTLGLVIAVVVLTGACVTVGLREGVFSAVWERLWPEEEAEAGPGWDTAVPLGQSVADGFLEVTVIGVRKEASIGLNVPGPNKIYVVATVEIANRGSFVQVEEYDTRQFSVLGSRNITYAYLEEPDTGYLLESGEILGGTTVSGDIVREVFAADTDLVLIWASQSGLRGYLALE